MNQSTRRIMKFVATWMLMNCLLVNVQAKEPSYNGKPLSEWICCSLPTDQYDVFEHLGTNCLPIALDLMGATDKKMKWVAMWLESRQLREMASSEDEGMMENIRESASRVFEVLGTNAVSAIPRLVKILNENDQDTSLYAADALGRVGPKGFAALTNVLSKAGGKNYTRAAAVSEIVNGDFKIVGPMLNGFLKDKNPDVRRFAAQALGGRDPDVAIPRLIPVLDDSDMEVKAAAATALGSYGANAMSAAPKIVSAYTNSINAGTLYQNTATMFGALKNIDLETAKKAEALVINSPKNPFRKAYTRTKLANGLELFVGGYIKSDLLFPTNHYLATAELYNPKTGGWQETGEMKLARFEHAAVLLPTGNVLVMGGDDDKYRPQSR